MELLKPEFWKQYELIDCGNFLKLEKFNNVITIRPEPQAIWKPVLSESKWQKMADVVFKPKTSASGIWEKIKNVPDQWSMSYEIKSSKKEINFHLALTGFKHVGIFPEQAVNWEIIAKNISEINEPNAKFLNLFAYTGGASLAAKASGADVTHVDSIKQVVSWANRNMEKSNLNNIRWVVEDAMKFVQREAKRGNQYHGIILDPPAYGHGANGEKWKLEENIYKMLEFVFQILHPQKSFLILNAYSLGFSSLIISNLLRNFVSQQYQKKIATGELYIESSSKLILPLGVFGRWDNFS